MFGIIESASQLATWGDRGLLVLTAIGFGYFMQKTIREAKETRDSLVTELKILHADRISEIKEFTRQSVAREQALENVVKESTEVMKENVEVMRGLRQQLDGRNKA